MSVRTCEVEATLPPLNAGFWNMCCSKSSLFASWLMVTLRLFDSCYMLRSAYGTIFKQSHQICLLLLNWHNVDPWLITVIQYMQPSRSCKNFSNFKIFQNLKLFKIPMSLSVKFYVVENKLKTNSIIANSFYNYSIAPNPGRRTTNKAGQKRKHNIELYGQRQGNFK
jgi:hypothetical protein